MTECDLAASLHQPNASARDSARPSLTHRVGIAVNPASQRNVHQALLHFHLLYQLDSFRRLTDAESITELLEYSGMVWIGHVQVFALSDELQVILAFDAGSTEDSGKGLEVARIDDQEFVLVGCTTMGAVLLITAMPVQPSFRSKSS